MDNTTRIGFAGTAFVTSNNTPASFAVNNYAYLSDPVPLDATSGSSWAINGIDPTSSLASRAVTFSSLTITGFTPTSGPVGTLVTITGTGFDHPITGGYGRSKESSGLAVFFNGVAATFTVVSDSQIDATVPPGATTGRITVERDGDVATSATDFVVILPPVISSFTPPSGPVGTVVTIFGSNFVGVI
ncbi:MAG: IPT/TIG domain-containing protein, partial [Chloracidobacterium sp.]